MAVPVVDLAAGPADDHAAQAAAIDAALREHGFFAVLNHGVDATVVAAAFDAGRRFFALAEADKRRWHIDGWPLKRGFDPVGWQALDPGQPPDIKESFYLGVEAIGPNQWPDEALVPGFRAAMQAYSAACDALARRLMALYERALGLPAGHFDGFMRQPTCTTRLLHYPPQPTVVAPGQIGCGAHTDWGALTLLAQDDVGGLQVQGSNGTWTDVTPIPGAFVVNIGDLMARWTHDRWRSTMHRVVNRVAGRERYSIAYFFDLDAEAVILPLPGCVPAGETPRYGPITAGEHLVEMYRRTTVQPGVKPTVAA
jgi:isopenicillin N synthase-like dioxygenase